MIQKKKKPYNNSTKKEAVFTASFFLSKSFYIFLFLFTFSLHSKGIKEMSLKEKVGQLLMTYVEGEEITDEAEKALRGLYLGGVILYNSTNRLEDPMKIKKFCERAQEISLDNSRLPLLIATDQEGGRVQRLRSQFTLFAGNSILGEKEPYLTQLVYEAIGSEMISVGVNMNLAPVVDVNSNPDNPVIGKRSFHFDAEEVALLGKLAIEGLQEAGVIPCIKHFPGHGDTAIDSHIGLPVVMKTKKEIENTELLPFKKLASISPVIMTAHILFPQIDPYHSATTSKTFLQSILREELGFSGVIITDSLTMGGVLQRDNCIEEAAVEAFLAGCDILLLGTDTLLCQKISPSEKERAHFNVVQKVQKALIAAIKKGRIPEERVDESLYRIFNLKKKIQISPQGNLSELVEEHKEIKALLH